MTGERMIDGETRPGEHEIEAALGRRLSLWSDLRADLAESYDHAPELRFDGPKYGWAIRYRKSGKTLVTLYPEHGGFTALVVLGKKEVEKAQQTAAELSRRVRDTVGRAEPLRDGLWLWIRPVTKSDVKSIELLLGAKRRPRTRAK